MSSTYRSDYAELELPDSADWAVARATYRRLVNQWHPDRYADKPRERAHAQARFIRLTRSFDRLRQFHRENDHLPFETAVVEHPETLQGRRRRDAEADAERRAPRAPDIDAELDIDPPFGATRADRSVERRDGAFRSLRWFAIGAALLAGTVIAVALFDRHQSQKSYEQGREVLRNTPPSEFLPSASEVRNSQTRGAFIQREDGKIGDQLAPDVFR